MLTDQRAPLPSCQHLAEQAILAARNDTVDNLNGQLLASMRGEVFASYSADKIIDQGQLRLRISQHHQPVKPSSTPTQVESRCSHHSLMQSQPIDRNVQWNTPLCCTDQSKSH